MQGFGKLQVAAAAMIVLSAACAKTDDADETALPADTMTAAPAPSSATPPSAPVVVTLAAVENSGTTGEATATHSPTDVTVAINVTGATGELPAHIHTGTCATGGPVAVELTKVNNGTSSTTVPLSSLPANQPSFVQVHNAAGKAIACGDMPGHGDGAAGTTGAPMGTTTTH